MKSIALLGMLVVALTLTGCARNYTITLTSGNRVTAKGKPKLENGYYVYTDPSGKKGSIPLGRVREVSPASMSSPRVNSGFSAEPTK